MSKPKGLALALLVSLGCGNQLITPGDTGGRGGKDGTGGSTGAGGSAGGSGGQGGSFFIVPDGGAAAGGSGGGDETKKCGFQQFALERSPATTLLVLDRSESMSRMPMNSTGATLWADAMTALDQVLKQTDSSLSWGLKMFPMGEMCNIPDPPEVPVAAMNYKTVMDAARKIGYSTVGGTPTLPAIVKSTAYLKTLTSKDPKYLVLTTDGEPNCPKGTTLDQVVSAVGDALTAGFKTFVVGIAITDTGIDTLNKLAVAGGTARNDPTFKFYPAQNKDDLLGAFGQITGVISSCVFPLAQVPPVPDNIAVKVDGVRVPQSDTDGWSYTSADHMGVKLNGSWCDKVKAATGPKVETIYGCPNVLIP